VSIALQSIHTLQFTTAHTTKSSQSAVSSPVSSALCSHSHPTSYSSDCCLKTRPAYNISAWKAQRTSLPTAALSLHSWPLWTLPSNSHCLQSHYLAISVVQLFILRLLPNNGSMCYIAPSLELFFQLFLLFRGMCFWRLWTASPPFPLAQYLWWLLSLMRCKLVNVYHHHLQAFSMAVLWMSLISFRPH
jgi:hypothetical protein